MQLTSRWWKDGPGGASSQVDEERVRSPHSAAIGAARRPARGGGPARQGQADGQGSGSTPAARPGSFVETDMLAAHQATAFGKA